jgi:hypothetical protein
MGKEELEWLSEHQEEMETYSSKWIALEANNGILAWGESVREVRGHPKEAQDQSLASIDIVLLAILYEQPSYS